MRECCSGAIRVCKEEDAEDPSGSFSFRGTPPSSLLGGGGGGKGSSASFHELDGADENETSKDDAQVEARLLHDFLDSRLDKMG